MESAVCNSINVVRKIFYEESNQGHKLQQLITSVLWQIWKRTLKIPLVVKLSNGCRFIAYPDCVTSSNVIYFRNAGFREMEFLRYQLNGGTLIDIGSNVGIVALSLADKIDHAILFEPNPIAALRAKENMALNSLNFEVHAIALSDKKGEIFLEDYGGPHGCNRTLADPSLTYHPVRKVQRTSLDIFLKDHVNLVKNISLVKIDVEGHENTVLKGMYETLIHLRPSMIMFEYLQRTNFLETQKILNAARYKIYLMEKNKLYRVKEKPKPLQDLFAFPFENCP